MNKLFFPILGAAALLSVSCSSDDSSPKSSPITLTRTQEEVVAQNNKMALGFFNEIVKESDEKAENLVFSPLSLSNALGMLANGADGKTLEEIKTVMGYESLDEINELHARLIKELPKADSKVTVALANAMWSHNGGDFSFFPEYVQNCNEFYNATCEKLDLYSLESANIINEWANKNTNGKITKLFNRPPECFVVLTNALYFNGEWTDEFEMAKGASVFYNSDETTTKLKLMESTKKVDYFRNDDVEAVSVPYGSGLYKMIVVKSLAENSIESLSSNELAEIQTGLETSRYQANLKMPEFKIEGNLELVEICIALGIKDAFGGDADFTKMAEDPGAVTEIFQIATIDVNRKGTEAAAVTVVKMDGVAAPPAVFVADRPFLYIIEETSSGAILFMGKVNKL